MLVGAQDPASAFDTDAGLNLVRQPGGAVRACWCGALRSQSCIVPGDGDISAAPMPNIELPAAAVAADLPTEIPIQIVSGCAAPPDGDGWLHEISTTGTASAVVTPNSLKVDQPQRLRPHGAVQRSDPRPGVFH